MEAEKFWLLLTCAVHSHRLVDGALCSPLLPHSPFPPRCLLFLNDKLGSIKETNPFAVVLVASEELLLAFVLSLLREQIPSRLASSDGWSYG